MKNVIILTMVLLLAGCSSDNLMTDKIDEQLMQKAKKLTHETIIVDTHVDVPYRLTEKMEDISVETEGGDFDYPRALQGGLNAPFMSIYIPAKYQETGGAKAFADSLIDMVNQFAVKWPDKFAIATSVKDVKSQFDQGLISLPMGMENGAPVEGKLQNLQYFYDRGIRYITLTHAKNNHICDASYDEERKWQGLSPFGDSVVAEMNRLGIMIDVSHVSDSTFYQVIQKTKAPVIASHSSCRHFTPGWERNMSDEMIKLLAKNEGVIQINFGSSFINDKYRTTRNEAREKLEESGIDRHSEEGEKFTEDYMKEHSADFADVSEVAAHIDHVVKLVGIDHVGIGSDFDGVGNSLPTRLKDVSYYPHLVYDLMEMGYTEEDIKKVCSGNIFRVWQDVENVAQKLQQEEMAENK